jgi:hypothetical protein
MLMETKELANSVIKSLFATIPFAGQPLNEIFYDYRGRIKQNRLNEFSSLLSAYFKNQSPVDFSALNAVEFSDLFESVILRVAHTGSHEKHKRFRDILTGYLQHPQQSMEHSDTFLELVSVLTEPSILVLKYHYYHSQEFDRLDTLDKALEAQLRKADREIESEHSKKQLGGNHNLEQLEIDQKERISKLQSIQEEQKTLAKYKKADFYGLDGDDFLYLKQILASRALMTDSAVGTIGHIQFNNMRITTFGKKFITYIGEFTTPSRLT